ncbi:MAG TPA: BamA/TamA family outer membrane protein [Anaeromyxobacteraceae bacterium]|nr:BamA/TamA family outer membrane protein [Anaeromyxobacteraceae bacterium]
MAACRDGGVLLLLLAAGCLHARGTAEAPAVVSVELEGVTAVDPDELRDKLATRASDRFTWGDARLLDPDALEFDRRRVLAFYRERGYYRAEVDPLEVKPDGDGRVIVHLRVREGEPVRVARVDVPGLDAAPEAAARAGKLSLEPGKVFTWAAFDEGRSQLQAALAGTGYATGTVTQSARVHAAEGTADVTYRVEAGPRFRFGGVSVSGTAEVPQEKVQAQAARSVTPGDWYDEARLERVQARVLELGVFGAVRVQRGEPDLEAGAMPVLVSVREAPFHTIRLGPGIGFDPSRTELKLQGAWIHRNWLGGLRQLRLDARGGYAWLPDPVSPIRQGVVGTLGAEFTQPAVIGNTVDFTIKVELEKSIEQAYESYSEKLRIGTPLRPAPRWTIFPSYNIEVYQLSNVTEGSGATIPEVQNCPSQVCVLSYLEQRISWDLRDNPLVTTSGLYASLRVQEGFHLGSVGYDYVGILPEVRYFQPLGGSSVLAARLRVGAIVPLGESGPAPVVALYTAGGSGGMRGYGAERLSPMVQQEDGTWVPTGGNGMIEGSVELRRGLGGQLVGALFLDVGNVSSSSGSGSAWTEVLDLSKLQAAIGIGIRYRTPFGPFRADLACRLPNDFSAGVPFEQRFPAVPGDSGHHEPIVAFHLTLGEAY